MSIDAIVPSKFGHIEGIGIQAPKATEPKVNPEGHSFGDMMTDALKEVDSLQKDATQKIEGAVLGGEGVHAHTAMLALQKAEVAFNLMTQVRSKLVRAYEEVMRTQV